MLLYAEFAETDIYDTVCDVGNVLFITRCPEIVKTQLDIIGHRAQTHYLHETVKLGFRFRQSVYMEVRSVH